MEEADHDNSTTNNNDDGNNLQDAKTQQHCRIIAIDRSLAYMIKWEPSQVVVVVVVVGVAAAAHGACNVGLSPPSSITVVVVVYNMWEPTLGGLSNLVVAG